MSTHPNTQPQTPEQDAAYYRSILHDLIDRGADLARRVHENAAAATPTSGNRPNTDPTPDFTGAFDRIARAVRRTIALARHIAADPANRTASAPIRQAARTRIIRGVEDAIHRRRAETDAEALYAELSERLDDPDLEQDIESRPVDEIIEEICRDLGVAMQARSNIWKRRTPNQVASLRARAAAPPPGPALQLIQGGAPPSQRSSPGASPPPAPS